MSIEVIPTGAALGAEIRGVDLARPIDDKTFAAIVGELPFPRRPPHRISQSHLNEKPFRGR